MYWWGIGIGLIAHVWLAVRAFREGMGWGLAALFIPFAGLLFGLLNFSDNKAPLALELLGFGLLWFGSQELLDKSLALEQMESGPALSISPGDSESDTVPVAESNAPAPSRPRSFDPDPSEAGSDPTPSVSGAPVTPVGTESNTALAKVPVFDPTARVRVSPAALRGRKNEWIRIRLDNGQLHSGYLQRADRGGITIRVARRSGTATLRFANERISWIEAHPG